jgi:hypothetical protein
MITKHLKTPSKFTLLMLLVILVAFLTGTGVWIAYNREEQKLNSQIQQHITIN